MASIDRRKTSKGEWRYDVRYRTPEGPERSRTFNTLKDAKRFANTVEADKLRGAWIDPRSASVTLEEFAEQWRTTRVHRPTTQAQVETNLRRHVYPFFGDRPVGSIRPSEIQAWVQHRSEVLAASTVEVVYRCVSSIFRTAVTDQLLVKSPCVGIRLPKRGRGQVVPLTTEQVHSLVDSVPRRYRALVVLAAGSGLRQGEALGLTLERVDFLGRRLTVDQQLVLLAKRAPELAPPKTNASYRTVPLPDVVLSELAAHLAEYPAVNERGLVFTDDKEAPISRTRFNADVWRPAVAASTAPARTGFHALRHYYASLLIAEGASVKIVQARLGHASAKETLNTYAHLWPESEDHTRSAVDRVLGAAVENQDEQAE
jgi:integrase